MHSTIEFSTLGRIDLAGPEGRDFDRVLRQPKLIALLAYLSVAGRDGYISRDKLLALFWPELNSDHARGALRTVLHRLRTDLGEEAIQSRGAEAVRLSDRVQCDANLLRALHAAGDVEGVLRVYRGEFLDGVYAEGCAPEFQEWLDTQRRELRSLAIESAKAQAQQRAQAGRSGEAVVAARRAYELAPGDEQNVQQLLTLLLRTGDRAGAIATFDDFSRRIGADFGIEPAAETRALLEPVRARPQNGAVAHPPSALPPVAPIQAVPHAVPAPPERGGSRSRRGVLLSVALVGILGYVGVRQLRAADATAAAWHQLPVTATDPIPRWYPVVMLDSTAGSVLLFGGRAGAANLADVWRLHGLDRDTPQWSRVRVSDESANGPQGRWLSAASYNPRSDRMILFGGAVGYTSPCSNDLWILRNVSGRAGAPAWQNIESTAAAPAPRSDHRLAYDHASNRVMLFGGHDCIAPVYTDYWILKHADGTTGAPQWERLAVDTSNGYPRFARGHAMGYNAATNRLIVFGGFDHETKAHHSDVWYLTNANGLGGLPKWHRLKVMGETPAGRINAGFGYDAGTNRLVITHGDGAEAPTDTWVLLGADGTTPESSWHRLPRPRGLPRGASGFGSVFDPVTDRLFLIGADGQGDRHYWVLTPATGWVGTR